jgi:hypothetical protein
VREDRVHQQILSYFHLVSFADFAFSTELCKLADSDEVFTKTPQLLDGTVSDGPMG